MKNGNYVGASALVLVSVGISAVVAYTVTRRTLTGLESVLWQIFVFAAGLAGSFIFGRQSAAQAARDMVKPHARSAFRRLLSLYESLHWAMNEIKSALRSGSTQQHQETLARVEAVVTAQLTTADDALEDWRDIVPEDVEVLKQKLTINNTTEDEK